MKLYAVAASKPHDFTHDLSEAEDLSEYADQAAHYREDDRSIRAAFTSREAAEEMREKFRGFGATANVFEAEAFDDEPAAYDWRSDQGMYIVERKQIQG